MSDSPPEPPRSPTIPATGDVLTEPGERVPGTVQWFNDSKHLGFVARDSTGENLLVHPGELECEESERELREGQKVSMVVVQGDHGLQPDKVRTEE